MVALDAKENGRFHPPCVGKSGKRTRFGRPGREREPSFPYTVCKKEGLVSVHCVFLERGPRFRTPCVGKRGLVSVHDVYERGVVFASVRCVCEGGGSLQYMVLHERERSFQ